MSFDLFADFILKLPRVKTPGVLCAELIGAGTTSRSVSVTSRSAAPDNEKVFCSLKSRRKNGKI